MSSFILGDFVLVANKADLVAGTETSGVALTWVYLISRQKYDKADLRSG